MQENSPAESDNNDRRRQQFLFSFPKKMTEGVAEGGRKERSSRPARLILALSHIGRPKAFRAILGIEKMHGFGQSSNDWRRSVPVSIPASFPPSHFNCYP